MVPDMATCLQIWNHGSKYGNVTTGFYAVYIKLDFLEMVTTYLRFVLEETEQGKAIWKRLHAALFTGFSRGTHQYYATGHNIHREQPKAVADAIRFIAAASQGGN